MWGLSLGVGPPQGSQVCQVYVRVSVSVGSGLKEGFPDIIVSPWVTLGQLSFYPSSLP